MHGEGEIFTSIYTYKGKWEHSRPHGKGVLRDHQHGNIYNGTFKSDPRAKVYHPLDHFKGTVQYADGRTFRGICYKDPKKGCRRMKGRVEYPKEYPDRPGNNPDWYEGEVNEDGVPHGKDSPFP